MDLTIQAVRVAHAESAEGALVFAAEGLVAILSVLSDEQGERAGRWFLECGFGRLSGDGQDFENLEEASRFIEDRLRA